MSELLKQTDANVTEGVTDEAEGGMTRRDFLIGAGTTVGVEVAGKLGIVERVAGWFESLDKPFTAFAGTEEIEQTERPRTPDELTAVYTPELSPEQVEWTEVGSNDDGRGNRLYRWHATARTADERMNVYAGDTALEAFQVWNPDVVDTSCGRENQRHGMSVIVPGGFNSVVRGANALVSEVVETDDSSRQAVEAQWHAREIAGDMLENDLNSEAIVVGYFNPRTRVVDHWINPETSIAGQQEVGSVLTGHPVTREQVHNRVTPEAAEENVRWDPVYNERGELVGWHFTDLTGNGVKMFAGNDGVITLQGWQGGYTDESCGLREGASVILPGIDNIVETVDNGLVRFVQIGEDQRREAVRQARINLGDFLTNDRRTATVVLRYYSPANPEEGKSLEIRDWIRVGESTLPTRSREDAPRPSPTSTLEPTAENSGAEFSIRLPYIKRGSQN